MTDARFGATSLCGLALLAVGVGAATAPARAPDVQGLAPLTAIRALEARHLQPFLAEPPQGSAGYVVTRQDPAPGSPVGYNGEVDLVFGRLPGVTPSPDTNAGVNAASKDPAQQPGNDPTAPDISSAPTAQAAAGTQPQITTVPNLHGLTLLAAAKRLRAAGLQLGALFGPELFSTRARIARSSPPAHSRVARGSSVDISLQPAAEMVPALVGLSYTTAAQRLAGAGLKASVSSIVLPGAHVAGQRPLAGTVADPGEAVVLVLVEPPELIAAATGALLAFAAAGVVLVTQASRRARTEKLMHQLRVTGVTSAVSTRLAGELGPGGPGTSLSWTIPVKAPRLNEAP